MTGQGAGSVRIIAGNWRGRTIDVPSGTRTRPTASRTREALFSILASPLGTFDGLRVLDLFAGSGALGFEALSRGAGEAVFVDRDRAAIDTIVRNIQRLQANARAVRADANAFRGSGVFGLVLADPPYESGAAEEALAWLARSKALSVGACVAVETSANEKVRVDGFDTDLVRDVGKARLHILRLS